MRGKRSKQYRKLMHQYGLSFNFREPYQVLLDADIIRDAERCKMKLGTMLQNTLHGEIKPMITQCCIRHLYTAEIEPGQKAAKEQWIEVAKQAERRRCGHHELEEPLDALECIQSVVDPKGSGSNKNRYIVASQDVEVRGAMRDVAGVPLIYINRSVMILEPMAAKSEQVRDAEEISKRKAGLRGRQSLVSEKRKRDDEDEEQGKAPAPKRNKLRGPKEPNPLSVKKSKKPAQAVDRAVTKGSAEAKPRAMPAADKENQPVENASSDPAHRRRKRKRKPDSAGDPQQDEAATQA